MRLATISNPCSARILRAAITMFSLAALSATATAGAGKSEHRGARRSPATLTGEIRLHGCTAKPREVWLRATPAEISRFDEGENEGEDFERHHRPHRRDVHRGHVQRVASHRLVFRVPKLRAGVVYHLGVQVRSETCGILRWEGPEAGLVTAGVHEPVVLDGWAIRSQVEILGLPAPGRRSPTWVGSDHLGLFDPDAGLRSFRWRSDLPGVTEGELQIATAKFATTRPTQTNCLQPEGLVYRKRVPFEPDGWGELEPVDLAAVLSPTRIFPREELAALDELPAPADPDEQWIPPSPETRALLDRGAPLYVRVVPVARVLGTATEVPACDSTSQGLHGWVVLVNLIRALQPGPEPPQLPVVLDPTRDSIYLPPIVADLPNGAKLCYRVIKPHTLPQTFVSPDAFGLKVALSSDYSFGQTLQPDEVFCTFQGSGGGFWSSLASGFGDLVTGAIDAIGAMVNGVAKLYDDIKKKAVESLASVLDALPYLNCGPNTLCRNAASYAVESGMVAVGLPPSLPNFDELVDEGLDYVTREIASQADIPPELVNLATGEAKKVAVMTIEQMKARRGIPGADWVVVEEFVRPATLTLRLSRSSTNVDVPDVIYIPEGDVFIDKVIPLPENLPVAPASLKVPITLIANLKNVTPPPPIVILGQKYPPLEPGLSRWMLKHWRDEKLFATPCTGFAGYLFNEAEPNHPLGQVLGVYVRPILHSIFDDPSHAECVP